MSWTPRSMRSPRKMTPLCTPRDTPCMTPFQLKYLELERLKMDLSRHLGRLNAVLVHYMDWFHKRRQSFLDALKTLRLSFPALIPQKHNTAKLFREMHSFAANLSRAPGLLGGQCVERMSEFLSFLDSAVELKADHDLLYDKMCDYCNSVKRLRDPERKTDLDRLQERLTAAFDEEFDFDTVHNERDNLFTYRLAQHDHTFHGLLSYVPYLLKLATNMCYWACQIYLEKE